MAGGIDWFRWHHGSVTDPKFKLVAKKAGARVADVLALWACLLEAASMSDERGNPGAPDFEALDCALELDDGVSSAIYARMQERGLVGTDGRIASWEKRQPKREREDDTAAERKRAQREREAAAQAAAPAPAPASTPAPAPAPAPAGAGAGVTAGDAPNEAKQGYVTPRHATSRQKTPRGEERREEEKKGGKDVAPTPDGDDAKPPAPSAEAWASYADAYELRYGIAPVRNAKVNGQMANFITRVGAEAPQIAAFFVGLEDGYYTREMHALDALVKDAEKLRTRWATGRHAPPPPRVNGHHPPASKHAGFAAKNYREGVNDDGSLS